MILGPILGTVFFIGAAILMFFTSDSDTPTKVFLLAIMFFAVLTVGVDAYDAGKKDGIEIGAYNQLHGKYRITHEIDADSCVIDTIIHFD
jgi:hypothetical protein